MRVVGMLMVLCVLAACGYKGSLYLPGNDPGKKAAAQ